MSVIEFVISDQFAYLFIVAWVGFIFGQIYERGRRNERHEVRLCEVS